MSIGLIGKKVGMTRVFDDHGNAVAVTVIDVSENEFLQVKTEENEGYDAVQVGYDAQKKQRLSKPMAGHLEKHGGSPKMRLQEFRVEPGELDGVTERAEKNRGIWEENEKKREEVREARRKAEEEEEKARKGEKSEETDKSDEPDKAGEPDSAAETDESAENAAADAESSAEGDSEEKTAKKPDHPGVHLFAEGQFVDVIGTSKGKGFQGVYKRYNFGGLPSSHGSMMHRRPGGIGCGTDPGRVWKNKEMPGRHGNYRKTIQNLRVVQTRPDDNVILISGAIPGAKGGYVVIRPAKKKPLPEQKG